MNWIKITNEKPPQNKVVKTKVDDDNGIRDIQDLVLRGNLWWFDNESMYVYYTPTHWCFK